MGAEPEALLSFCFGDDLALQERSVERTLDYAERPHRVIERFGRFPHRNALLGRASSTEEEAFLAAGADAFAGTPHGT